MAQGSMVVAKSCYRSAQYLRRWLAAMRWHMLRLKDVCLIWLADIQHCEHHSLLSLLIGVVGHFVANSINLGKFHAFKTGFLFIL